MSTFPLAGRVLLALPLLVCSLDAQLTLLKFKANSLSGREYGNAVACIGDVDHDGFQDMAIGIPFDSNFVGAVHVRSGRDGHLIKRLVGDTLHTDQFGGFLNAAGDVDRDGTPDLLVSATQHQKNGVLSGRVYVISGRTWKAIHVVYGRGAGDIFGSSAANVGDIDGDGYTDFLVGAPENGDPVNSYGTGYADLFSGKTGKVIHHFQGYQVTSEFGLGVGAPGDVDKDGVPDLLIGSALEGQGWGSARLYSGKTKKVIHSFPPTWDGDHFGMILGPAGDVDADGFLDIVLGQPNAFAPTKGRVFVFSGKTGKQLHRIEGLPKSGMHAMSIGGVGDINGDGHADFAAGDPMDGTSGKRTGSIRIYSGKTGKQLHVIYGKGGLFGFNFAVMPDCNGDGMPEFLAASKDEVTAGSSRGTVRVVTVPSSAKFGFGCSLSRVGPSLDATALRLGRDTTFFVRGDAYKSGAMFWSAVPDVPLRLGRTCAVHLDLRTMVFVRSVTTDAIGRWTRLQRVPSQQSLIGCVGAIQCALGPTSAPLGVDMTNGFYFTITK